MDAKKGRPRGTKIKPEPSLVELAARDATSVVETARLAGLSHVTVYGEIAAGMLETVKIGRRRLVPRFAREAWLRKRLDTNAPAKIA